MFFLEGLEFDFVLGVVDIFRTEVLKMGHPSPCGQTWLPHYSLTYVCHINGAWSWLTEPFVLLGSDVIGSNTLESWNFHSDEISGFSLLLKMKAACSSETSVTTTNNTRCHGPVDQNLYHHVLFGSKTYLFAQSKLNESTVRRLCPLVHLCTCLQISSSKQLDRVWLNLVLGWNKLKHMSYLIFVRIGSVWFQFLLHFKYFSTW
jgi:hypothetical protein